MVNNGTSDGGAMSATVPAKTHPGAQVSTTSSDRPARPRCGSVLAATITRSATKPACHRQRPTPAAVTLACAPLEIHILRPVSSQHSPSAASRTGCASMAMLARSDPVCGSDMAMAITQSPLKITAQCQAACTHIHTHAPNAEARRGAPRNAGQPARLLLARGQSQEVGQHNVRPQVGQEARAASAAQLLAHNRIIAEICQPMPAILLWNGLGSAARDWREQSQPGDMRA